MIDSTPEVMTLAVDPDEHLIQMPAPMREVAHSVNPLLADLAGEHRTEPVPPEPDRLVADVDAALGQKVLDLAQRQREADVHHDDRSDHLRRAVEPSKRVVGPGHEATLTEPITGATGLV